MGTIDFSPVVLAHWRAPQGAPGEPATVTVDSTLGDDLLVSVLVPDAASPVVRVAPATAEALGLTDGDQRTIAEVHGLLDTAGTELNGADALFYLTPPAQQELRDAESPSTYRALTDADGEAFARFADTCPDDDLDEAYVEIDHWRVFGAFDGEHLVAAASAYPWRDTRLADIGIVTLPAARGRGIATGLVRALAADALAHGYEPQYRCQLDNTASVALARAAGFTRFGTWDVVTA